MSDDIFNISFDEIVKQSEEAENTEIERVLEINSYEKLYLLKPNENGDPSCELSDEEKLSLYHDVVFSGLRRYYVENLAVRDFTLEGSIPYQLEIFDKVVQDNSWGNFLCKVVLLLLDKYPEKREDIVNFRTDWTKVPMFTVERKTNSKPIYNDLFLNCNHTALHSCWLLQDILNYFEVDVSTVRFIINRPTSIEQKKIIEHIEKLFILGFKAYLSRQYNFDSEKADKVVANIYKFLNPVLGTISKSYTNLFLFDDLATLAGYIKKVRDVIQKSIKFDIKAKNVLSKYLMYLSDYYKL